MSSLSTITQEAYTAKFEMVGIVFKFTSADVLSCSLSFLHQRKRLCFRVKLPDKYLSS